MDIAIVGRHTKVSADLREKISERMAKIQALAPKATRAEVHVVHERNPRHAGDSERVEITLHNGKVIRAEASSNDRVVALDLAAGKVIERLRRIHDRKATRHQSKVPLHALPPLPAEEIVPVEVESVREWEGQPEGSVREIPLDGTPILIRSKRHSAAPMSVPEAIDEMELVGHDFYLFLDSESGLPSAVYRRRGWTYGVIHLEEGAGKAEAEDRDIA